MLDPSVVLPPAKWLSERPFDAPSAFDSGMERTKMDAGYFRPFTNAFFFTAKCYEHIFSGISGLFFLGSPPTVFRTVWAIIVYPVNRLIAFWFAHIGSKICVVKPSFANINAAPAIMLIGRVIFVSASLLHSMPYLIASRVFVLVFARGKGSSVRYMRARRRLFMGASTGSGMFSFKVQRKHHSLISAIALAQPFCPRCLVFFGAPNNC